MYIQKTPEICEFLGLAKPSTTTASTSTESTSSHTTGATEPNKKPSTNNDDGNKHPAEKAGSIGGKFVFQLIFIYTQRKNMFSLLFFMNMFHKNNCIVVWTTT